MSTRTFSPTQEARRKECRGDDAWRRQRTVKGQTQTSALPLPGGFSMLNTPLRSPVQLASHSRSAPQHLTEEPHAPSRAAGRPLESTVRRHMEAAFGTDFSGVRIQEGPQAARMGALAYTQGNDIYFAPGRYHPNSFSGRALLGHELTHVQQQRAGRVGGPQARSQNAITINKNSGLESEAERLGERAALGERVQVAGASYSGAPRNQPQCSPVTGVIQRAAVLTGRRLKSTGEPDLNSDERCSQLIRAARSVGSETPMKFFVANDKQDAGKRGIQEVWDGPGATRKIFPKDHIDIFGHSAGNGYPGGLSPQALLDGIKKHFKFARHRWKGDMRIFSCYSGRAYDSRAEKLDDEVARDNTRIIMQLGRLMSNDSRFSNVQAIGGPTTKGNLGPAAGEVFALNNVNKRTRKNLGTMTLEKLKHVVHGNLKEAGVIESDETYFKQAQWLPGEKEKALNLDDAGKIRAMIHTAINRSATNSAWRIARPNGNKRWQSSQMPLVGEGPAQVKLLRSVPVNIKQDFKVQRENNADSEWEDSFSFNADLNRLSDAELDRLDEKQARQDALAEIDRMSPSIVARSGRRASLPW